MCDTAVSKNVKMLKYCHDKYKTQEICGKAVDDSITALKWVPDWFVSSKMKLST